MLPVETLEAHFHNLRYTLAGSWWEATYFERQNTQLRLASSQLTSASSHGRVSWDAGVGAASSACQVAAPSPERHSRGGPVSSLVAYLR